MDYIMVTLQTGAAKADLRVPVFVTVGELLDMFAAAMGLERGSQGKLQAEPLGRILHNSKTLEQEGVAHGALLTLI